MSALLDIRVLQRTDDEILAELPVTDDYAARTVTLPMFATMTRGQQDEVVDAIRAALDVAALAR